MDSLGSFESFFHQLVPFGEGDQQLMLSLYNQQQQQLQQQQQGGVVQPNTATTTNSNILSQLQQQSNNNSNNNNSTNNNNVQLQMPQIVIPQQQMYYPQTTSTTTTTTTPTQSSSSSSSPVPSIPQPTKKMSKKQLKLQQQQQQLELEIKNEPPSPDSDSDDDRENKKNRSRANQNLASRNYRQRKKEYIKDIEEKLAVLALENDQLKKENVNLKKGGGVEIMKPDPAFITMMMEAKQIIIQLDVAIKKNDDRSLIYLLQLFHLSIEKRHSIVEREVEKMVHPYTQAKLAAMGYVPSLENPMISSISGPSSDSWWIKYMSEAHISEEQAKAIKQLRANHWKADIELRNERERLDRSIKEFYLSKVMVFPTNERLNKSFATNLSITDAPIPQPISNGSLVGDHHNVDISEILEFTRKLESLKKNFVKQRTLMEDTHSALSSILTPRQEAMLLVRVHSSTRYDFANMEMLKNVWGSVVSKDANFPPPPPHFPQSILNNQATTPITQQQQQHFNIQQHLISGNDSNNINTNAINNNSNNIFSNFQQQNNHIAQMYSPYANNNNEVNATTPPPSNNNNDNLNNNNNINSFNLQQQVSSPLLQQLHQPQQQQYNSPNYNL